MNVERIGYNCKRYFVMVEIKKNYILLYNKTKYLQILIV